MSKIASRILHGISATSCVLLCVCAVQPSPAVAQTAPTQDRPVSLRLGSTVSWDANVLRVPDSVTDPLLSLGKRGRSDQIHTTSIGLRFEKAFSLQYFLFDVTATATRYDKS